jgi:hypothetical protein
MITNNNPVGDSSSSSFSSSSSSSSSPTRINKQDFTLARDLLLHFGAADVRRIRSTLFELKGKKGNRQQQEEEQAQKEREDKLKLTSNLSSFIGEYLKTIEIGKVHETRHLLYLCVLHPSPPFSTSFLFCFVCCSSRSLVLTSVIVTLS